VGRGCVYVLVGETGLKRPLGRPRRGWGNNIRMDLWEDGVYRFFVGKTEGKRTLGRPRRRWVDYIRMDLWVEGW